MKIICQLFLFACCLGPIVLGGANVAVGQDEFAWGEATGTGMSLSGADVWGRVNPSFCGFPTFAVATDLVVLGRSTPAQQAILFDDSFNSILDAEDFGNPSQAGARINLTFFDQGCWDFMLDMLFMGDMTSQQRVDTTSGVNLFFYQGVAVNPVNTASFRSDLDTGELNFRRRYGPDFALLFGVRYLELNENLDFNQGGGSGGYTSQSDNRLIGPQVGAEAVLPLWGYGRAFATGKYGVYNNRFNVNAQATSGGAPISISVRDDMAAYVGEANIGWEVQTVPCMTLRFGYQGFWLQNMALTTDQLNQYSIFSGDGRVRRGFAGFHGWFGGLVFTF